MYSHFMKDKTKQPKRFMQMLTTKWMSYGNQYTYKKAYENHKLIQGLQHKAFITSIYSRDLKSTWNMQVLNDCQPRDE